MSACDSFAQNATITSGFPVELFWYTGEYAVVRQVFSWPGQISPVRSGQVRQKCWRALVIT